MTAPTHQPGLEVAVHNAPEVPVHPGLEPYWEHQQEKEAVASHHGTAAGGYGETTGQDAGRSNGRILGLRRKHFWIAVAVAAVVVVGAVVGGGVGGAMANKDKSNDESVSVNASSTERSDVTSRSTAEDPPAPTTTTTSFSSSSSSASSTASSTSSTSSRPFPTTGILALDCPAIDRQTYIATVDDRSFTFRYHCQADTSGDSGLLRDQALSVEACADMCAKLAAEAPRSGRTIYCRGVTWNGNLTASVGGQGGNCFLKYAGEEGLTVSGCGESCQMAASAVLIEED